MGMPSLRAMPESNRSVRYPWVWTISGRLISRRRRTSRRSCKYPRRGTRMGDTGTPSSLRVRRTECSSGFELTTAATLTSAPLRWSPTASPRRTLSAPPTPNGPGAAIWTTFMGRVCGSVVRAAPIDPERVTLGSLASSIHSTEGFARRVLTCASAAPPPQRAWDVETQEVSGTVPALARPDANRKRVFENVRPCRDARACRSTGGRRLPDPNRPEHRSPGPRQFGLVLPPPRLHGTGVVPRRDGTHRSLPARGTDPGCRPPHARIRSRQFLIRRPGTPPHVPMGCDG